MSDDPKTLLRDGVRIPLPRDATERMAFEAWMKRNRVSDPYNPEHHYDNLGAFRGGVDRAPGEEGHFPDTYKLPGHKTFSNESQYATGENAKYAGSWPADAKTDADFIPPAQKYAPKDPRFESLILNLLNAIAGSKIHDR